MLLLDVNVVVAAARDDHPAHASVTDWWNAELVGERADFGVPVGVWGSFLRLVTHRRVFDVPTPLPDAFAFVRAVRSYPTHVALDPGPRHVELLERVCTASDATGSLVPDAVLAAVAIEHGATLVTLDRDVGRFRDVRAVRPER